MPKVYAYLRRVPIQKQYVVSYPYGVGGTTLLDQLANTVNFDNWLVTSVLSYFSARYLSPHWGVRMANMVLDICTVIIFSPVYTEMISVGIFIFQIYTHTIRSPIPAVPADQRSRAGDGQISQ